MKGVYSLKRVWMLLFVTIVLLSGCGKKSAYEPVEINPDIDICDICNMSITVAEYATQAIMPNGSIENFDDIGCMIDFLNETSEKPGAMFVRDANSGEWIAAEQATYLYNEDYWTPMMYGVVAFKDATSAEQFTAENNEGETFKFDEVVTHFTEQGSHSH